MELRLLLSCLFVYLPLIALGQSRTQGVDDQRPGELMFGAEARQPLSRSTTLPQLPGWPQTMIVNPLYSPSGITLADLDGDDSLEVVAGSTDGKLYAWSHTGSLLPGYPVTVGARIMAPPAIGDVNEDGTPEIAVTTVAATYLYNSNGTLRPGWPKTLLTNAFGFSAPVLCDIDGNGTLEVIQGSGSNTGNLGRIFIWNEDGTSLPGWPQTLGNSYRIVSTVSVGDLDGDGYAEIIAVGKKAGADTVKVYAYHADSTQVSGWPYTAPDMGASWSAAAIGNIDTLTPSLEVAFTAANFFGGYGNLYVVNANGTTTSGFPVPLPLAQNYPSVVLGDIDRDGLLEIVCGGTGNNGLLYSVRSNGTILPGWPQSILTNMEGTAVIANVDTSASREVINGDNFTANASLFAFTVSGQQSPQFPVTMSGSMSVNSAAIADVDRDGTLEIALVNGNGTVNLWTTGVADSQGIEWGTFYHDNQHTGNYHFQSKVVTSIGETVQKEIPVDFGLLQNYPNPFNPITNIVYDVPARNHIEIKIFNMLGEFVATIVNEEQEAGSYRVEWEGRNTHHQTVASGIYLCVMRSGEFVSTRKLVLLR